MKYFAQRVAAVLLLLALINTASYGPGTRATLAFGMGTALVVALAYFGHQAVTIAWDERLRTYQKADKNMTRTPSSSGWGLTLVGLLSALVVVVTGVLWGIR